MKRTIKSGLAVAFLTLAGCSQEEQDVPVHPDGDLYSSDHAFQVQRGEMMCLSPDAALPQLPLLLADVEAYQPIRTFTYYFDKNQSEPLSPDSSFQRLVDVVLADKDLGVHLEGCADPSGSAAYNLELSRKRAEAVARRLEQYGVHPDRICIVPKGEGCTTPERKVELQTFRIGMEP